MSVKASESTSGKKPVPAVEKEFLPLKVQYGFLVLLCLILYGNTLWNEFALDDYIVITENKFVKKGLGGIGRILSKDSFAGFLGERSLLAGGRWRPLSLIVFAIEYGLFKKNSVVFHFTNMAFYALCCLVFFRLARRFIFSNHKILAFFAALVFAVHPVHTEVVANIKSLDEILSLLFLMLTLYYGLIYLKEERATRHLYIALGCYFLALLSKENGLTFLVLIPVSFYFLTPLNIRAALIESVPFFIVGSLYSIIRFTVFGSKALEAQVVLNAPYLYASGAEALATKVLVLGKYLLLLLFPHPLVYDYSYNQIPYVSFGNASVLLSLLVHAALLVYALLRFPKKDLIAYCILFYLFSISIVSNFVIDIGATMGERFLFQPSVAFSILLVFVAYRMILLLPALAARRVVAAVLTVAVVVLSGYKTVTRNPDWKNNNTLFMHDVQGAPRSVKTNMNAGIALIFLADSAGSSEKKKEMLYRAVAYFQKARAIDTSTIDAYLNTGVAYQHMEMLDSAERYWNIARHMAPNHSKLKEFDEVLSTEYMRFGLNEGRSRNFLKAIGYFNKSVKYNPENAEAWYNLGGVYYTVNEFEKARDAWTTCLKLKPDHAQAQQGMNALPSATGR